MINRELHFSLTNEQATLAEADPDKTFQVAEKEVIHYLLEHILQIENPYLFPTEEEQTASSYKLLEISQPEGGKILQPVDYKETTFEELCASPYRALNQRAEQQPLTLQEKRMIRRFKAEMLGARKLTELIFQAKDGSYFIWSSPPGNKKDGYWDSSITYLAQVNPPIENKREITCWRCVNHLPLAEHRNFLNLFLPQDQQLPPQPTAEEVLLRPALITLQEAQQCGLTTISDLINFLYTFDYQVLNEQQIKQQIEKIDRLRQILTPQIKKLAEFLKNGWLVQAEKQLDQIEQTALANFFNPEELLKIISGQSLKIDPRTIGRLNDLAVWAWQTRRQEMDEQGTSCPAVSQPTGLPTSPIEQLLNQIQTELGFSKEDNGSCPDCHINKGKYACCKNCPYNR